jgi:hypothetical protein
MRGWVCGVRCGRVSGMRECACVLGARWKLPMGCRHVRSVLCPHPPPPLILFRVACLVRLPNIWALVLLLLLLLLPPLLIAIGWQ